jgi:hypothetical protein
VTARAIGSVGLLPSPAPGAAWSAEFPAARAFQATVGVIYLPETRTGGDAFAFGFTAAWLGGCAQAWGERRVSLSVCGEVLLGAMHAVVFALEPTHPGDRFWSGASLAGQVRWRVVGPFVLELGVQGLLPFARPRYLVSGQPGTVFQEAAAGGAAFVGAGVSIP